MDNNNENSMESDDFTYKIDYSNVSEVIKRKEEIPIQIWIEHFSKPEKDRNRLLTNMFDKELAIIKAKYSFLHKSQIFGRMLRKFGIPNICGKISKLTKKHLNPHHSWHEEHKSLWWYVYVSVADPERKKAPTRKKQKDIKH